MDMSPLTAVFVANPEIGALIVIIAGVVLARTFAAGATRLAGWLDQRIARYSTSETYGISPASLGLLRGLVFWLTLAISVVIALRILGVGGFATALDQVLAFVPRLLIGLVIIAVGHLLGTVVSGLAMRATQVPGISLAPRIVYVSILTVAVVMGLQQMGIDTSFLTQLLLVFLVVSLGGLTLAFALGAREYVANLIARSEIERYSIGDRLRIGEHQGTVLEIRSTGLDLGTEAGVVSIPAAQFTQVAIIRLADSTDE